MKKIILSTLLLLAGTSSSALADWVRVSGNDKVVVFADATTMRKKGNIVKISSLFDFKTESVYNDGNSYMSIVRETEFNCKDNLQRMISYAIYAGKMGKGNVVDSGTNLQDWKPVSKAGIAISMKKFACESE